MDEERREHVQKMKKMEAEMEQVFEMKVKEKMQKLKDSETDVCCIDITCCTVLHTVHVEKSIIRNSRKLKICCCNYCKHYISRVATWYLISQNEVFTIVS